MQGERPRRLSERTVDFGLAAMEFCEALPRSAAGRHIGDQLLRSATSARRTTSPCNNPTSAKKSASPRSVFTR